MKKSRKFLALLIAMVLCLGTLTPCASAAYNVPDATPAMLYRTVADKTGITADGDTMVKYGYITESEKQFFDRGNCVTAVVAWRILFQVYGINYYPADYYPGTEPMENCKGLYADASVAAILLRLAVPDAQAHSRLSETDYTKLVYALEHGQYQALPDPVTPNTTPSTPPSKPPASSNTSTNAPTWGIISKPNPNNVSADKLISTQVYDRDSYNRYYDIVLASLEMLPPSWINDFYNNGWKIIFKWQVSDPNSTAAKKLTGVSGLTSYTDKVIYIGSYNAKTILHEFTHYAAWRVGWNAQYLQYYFDTESYGVVKTLSAYSQTKPAEYFAEFVAYWVVYPDTCPDLERGAPNTAAHAKDLLVNYDALLAAKSNR